MEPWRESIERIAVESTYNWYWLVDGLRDAGYDTVLAHPPALCPYEGIKYTDDKSDAFFLAEMLRLGILQTGYVYDPEMRPVRDLLRRRLALVRKRTSVIVSFKSLHVRMTGKTLALSEVKRMSAEEGAALYSHPADQVAARLQLQLIAQLTNAINEVETQVRTGMALLPAYGLLQTLPGVGKILALTIALETGDINRFPDPGHYASYCRCVDSKRLSNQKKKGENNERCGNNYLSWAWVEAANFARRFDEGCRKFFDRKKAQTNSIVATKALACKLAKAAWHIMHESKPYDPERMFPSGRKGNCCLGQRG